MLAYKCYISKKVRKKYITTINVQFGWIMLISNSDCKTSV